jgi:hypothetical protein
MIYITPSGGTHACSPDFLLSNRARPLRFSRAIEVLVRHGERADDAIVYLFDVVED